MIINIELIGKNTAEIAEEIIHVLTKSMATGYKVEILQKNNKFTKSRMWIKTDQHKIETK